MTIYLSDVTGWIDETGVVTSHILTGHAAIASLAIMMVAILIVQLLPRLPDIDPEDDLL